MCRISGYKHLSFAAARALADSRDADFAVYLPPPAGHEPVLYREEAAGLSTPDFERLKENGVEFLLVRSDDVAQCEELVEARLGDLLTSPDVVPPEKAEVLHTVGSVLAEGLTGDPGDDQQVQRTSRYVDNVIQGLLDDPAVSPYVLQMAEYERSTASHMMIVSALAVVLGHEVYGADTQALKDLGMAGMLHDLGKLAISPQTLSKTTPLTRQEMRMIEQHPIESVRLLDDAQH